MAGILLLVARALRASILMASADEYISNWQRVYSTSTDNSYYWAMIGDYAEGLREDATSGHINYTDDLSYECQYWDVQVAYIYSYSKGKYIEALTMRDVIL